MLQLEALWRCVQCQVRKHSAGVVQEQRLLSLKGEQSWKASTDWLRQHRIAGSTYNCSLVENGACRHAARGIQ